MVSNKSDEVTDGSGDHYDQPALSEGCTGGLVGFVFARDKLGSVEACI